MATKTLEENVNQAVNDFKEIKAKIVEKGVQIESGTPTSAYPQKIEELHQKAVDDTADIAINAVNEQADRLETRLNGNSTESQGMYDKVFNDGYSVGVVDGKQAERDLLWDNIQNNGKKTVYNNTFQFWHSEVFYPKYDIKPTKMASIFEDFDADKTQNPTLDLVERLNFLGLTFDTSKCTNWTSAFFRCSIARIGIINAKKANSPFNSVFYCYYGHTIDKLILPDDVDAVYGNLFAWDKNLVNIEIEGTLGGKNITEFGLHYCPLSKSSIINFVNVLSDTTTNKSITFNTNAVNTAFETSEGAKDGSTSEEWQNLIATKPNWTVALATP